MRYLLTLLVVLNIPMVLTAGGAETCFGKGERIDGQNKICYYECISGGAAITIKSYQLCPLTIKR